MTTAAAAMPIDINRDQVAAVRLMLQNLQNQIVAGLETLDGGSFQRDAWERPQGGGGESRVIEGSHLLERGGVNFSHVMGETLPASATAHRPELAGRAFEAMGVSLVLHPENPYVPTVHMNVRFFIAYGQGDQPAVWWFGGGMDMTPYYPFAEDAKHFHQTCHNALQSFGEQRYPDYKAWCDRYFFLKHRQEPRGIGGIFFDDLNDASFDTCFALTQSVGEHFLPAWLPIAEKRRHHAFGPREREFQSFRRGRYVEFNLVWDRGTLFGLQTGGRTESILMSMPPHVTWRYDWRPEAGTPEAGLYDLLMPPRDWLA